MGKHNEAERTGECYNCGKCVGKDNLIVNHETRWPVCEDCDIELRLEYRDPDEF